MNQSEGKPGMPGKPGEPGRGRSGGTGGQGGAGGQAGADGTGGPGGGGGSGGGLPAVRSFGIGYALLTFGVIAGLWFSYDKAQTNCTRAQENRRIIAHVVELNDLKTHERIVPVEC